MKKAGKSTLSCFLQKLASEDGKLENIQAIGMDGNIVLLEGNYLLLDV